MQGDGHECDIHLAQNNPDAIIKTLVGNQHGGSKEVERIWMCVFALDNPVGPSLIKLKNYQIVRIL